ncbi:hypothetical protein Zmor_004795 [Zophobas morio]|uniref:BHLH domain-containing protein n=2 Tax=Zophobas morio TaxID=2755281 RepID=A0AA38IWJ8_9CUCU|nr:hypothetical protein Zmor_004795 [Zophobas morio]
MLQIPGTKPKIYRLDGRLLSQGNCDISDRTISFKPSEFSNTMDGYEEPDTRVTSDYHLLSDDVWKEFQIEEMQLHSIPDDDVVAHILGQRHYQVKYDCMWNGHSKGGPGIRSIKSESPTPPADLKPPVVQAQQSLLKPDLKLSVDPNTVVPMMPYYSLQTPPISDDEDTKPMTHILESLETALNENELEIDDGDLSDYFKEDGKEWGFFDEEIEEEEEEEEKEVKDVKEVIDVKPTIDEQQENEKRAFYAATDHSYHKGTHPGMLPGNLGIDTPSDSEEEIDVVSVGGGDKFCASKSAANALPTNPSTKDRRHIQRTMQSRFPQGLKTILPVKRAAPNPKKVDNRGRGRQYKRVKGNHRQYKRRYGYSSDSEPEPSEKRHLHNNMERQRRIDLRNLFNDLKKLLPDVSKKPRAAKVAILRGASAYCKDLTYTDQMLKKRIELMRQQQMRLRAEVSKLRRDVVAKR